LGSWLKRRAFSNEDQRSQGQILAEFEGWAQHVHLNFTHFILLDNQVTKVPLNYLEKLWHQGAAVQCTNNQSVIDGFLVGYHGTLNQAFNAQNLIMIPFQTKSRASNTTGTAEELTCPFISASGHIWKPSNYLVIYMDLFNTLPFDIQGSPQVTPTKQDIFPSGDWKGYAVKRKLLADLETKPFCLNVCGHDPNSYKVLAEFVHQQIF
jgi:hypothetical protein